MKAFTVGIPGGSLLVREPVDDDLVSHAPYEVAGLVGEFATAYR